MKGFNHILIEKIISSLKKNVYITFDVDYFDPSIMPSTGTPEPNGFYWDETFRLLKRFVKKRTWLVLMLWSLPRKRITSFPDFLTAKLIYKILNYKF